MQKLVLFFFLLFYNGVLFSQIFYKEWLREKARELVTPKIELETYIMDFDAQGEIIYGAKWVSSFNLGVRPMLLDSNIFYKLREEFILDSNFVFVEKVDVDFANPIDYASYELINPNRSYIRTAYREFIGSAADEDKVKNEKFVYFFVGETSPKIPYIHVLQGIPRRLF